jgi:hypothetical protein
LFPTPSGPPPLPSSISEPDDVLVQNNVTTEAFARILGHGCAAVGVAIAFIHGSDWEVDNMLHDMMARLECALVEARSGLSFEKIMNVRLFYVPSEVHNDRDWPDAALLHASLRTVISARIHDNAPATTVVPVLAIDSIGNTEKALDQLTTPFERTLTPTL